MLRSSWRKARSEFVAAAPQLSEQRRLQLAQEATDYLLQNVIQASKRENGRLSMCLRLVDYGATANRASLATELHLRPDHTRANADPCCSSPKD
jgi:hypothetical protein